MNNISQRYHQKLDMLPPAGLGLDCHTTILSASNLGIMAGLSADEIFRDIRSAIPHGKRPVHDSEIWDAIHKAQRDVRPAIVLPNGRTLLRYRPAGAPRPKVKPVIADGKATLQRIIEQSNIVDDVGLRNNSPTPINWGPEVDTVKFLQAMFSPQDLIYIGKREEPGIPGGNIRLQVNWIKHFESGGRTAPFIICNPLTGRPAPKKSGDGETFRGDASIANFKFCICEFDTLNRENQIRFWTSAISKGLPVVALIDSGGKSLHAWIEVDGVNSLQDWQFEIRDGLYEKTMIPLGVDRACSNPARLSRLPGHVRDNGNWQRILWLKGNVVI